MGWDALRKRGSLKGTVMRPQRLNLGCGTSAVSGWVNIDRSPGMLLDRVRPLKRLLRKANVLSEAHMAEWPLGISRIDVRKGLPYPDGAVDAIYSSHMLEHIYLNEAKVLLSEAFRVLRPGGVIRLALPDAERLVRSFLEDVDRDPAQSALRFNAGLWTYPSERPAAPARLAAIFGANVHRWQPTEGLTRSMLQEAGFQEIERRNYREGLLPDLERVEHREQSFFLEAVR